MYLPKKGYNWAGVQTSCYAYSCCLVSNRVLLCWPKLQDVTPYDARKLVRHCSGCCECVTGRARLLERRNTGVN
jgi:hypothetical protein